MDDPFADLFGPPKPAVPVEQENVQPMKASLESVSNASKSETPSAPGECAAPTTPHPGVVQPISVMLKEDARDYIAEAVQASVQDAMSKIIGSMRSVLEQVTQRVQSVEHEMSELAKVVKTLAIEDVNATLNARFAVVDAAIKEVGRSVQAMRDRAELLEANSELAKLTAQSKKPCNDCQSEKSAPTTQPSPSAPALSSQPEAPLTGYQPVPTAQPPSVQAPPPAPVAPQPPSVTETSSSNTMPPAVPAPAPAAPHAYAYGAPPSPASASQPFSAPPPPAGLSAPPFSAPPHPAGPPAPPAQPTHSYGPPPQYTPPMPPQAPQATPAYATYAPPPASATAPSYAAYPSLPQGPPAPPLPRPNYAPNPAPPPPRYAPPPAPSRSRVEGTSQMSTQQVVQDLCQMGFEKQSIENVIGQMIRNGQSVDLNVIVDRLMNGGGR